MKIEIIEQSSEPPRAEQMALAAGVKRENTIAKLPSLFQPKST